MVVSDLKADARVMLVTAMAYTKRVMLRDFGNILKTGIIACTLEPGDQVISARLTGGKDHVIVATNTGKAIVFPEDQVRVMGRQAQGVRAISLSGKDAVVGMDVITSPDDYVINLTELGFGKKTLADKYPVQKRAGKGVYTVHITNKTGNLVGIRVVKPTDELIIISTSGQIIRIPATQIRTTSTRSAQGVRAIRMMKNEKIVDFALYLGEEDE